MKKKNRLITGEKKVNIRAKSAKAYAPHLGLQGAIYYPEVHADHAVPSNTFKSAARKSFCYAIYSSWAGDQIKSIQALPATCTIAIAIYRAAMRLLPIIQSRQQLTYRVIMAAFPASEMGGVCLQPNEQEAYPGLRRSMCNSLRWQIPLYIRWQIPLYVRLPLTLSFNHRILPTKTTHFHAFSAHHFRRYSSPTAFAPQRPNLVGPAHMEKPLWQYH